VKVKVAALQTSMSRSVSANIERVTELVREAAGKGAQIILPSELFETHYFCKRMDKKFFDLARPEKDHPTIEHFRSLCRELKVVIPVSFFEREGSDLYNSLVVVDADGSVLGKYRKTHIPEGPGYEEKFYFKGGDTGFRVWDTKYGKIGVGICWDQWFPECARAMVLESADILFYPTAIGSEPEAPELDTRKPWQRVMIGHAVANMVGVVAANRVGDEDGQVFYGHSFISDQFGEKLVELDAGKEGVIVAELDLDAIRASREDFGFFRHRRPELYGKICEKNSAVSKSTSNQNGKTTI